MGSHSWPSIVVCHVIQNTFLLCFLLGGLCDKVHPLLQFEHVHAHNDDDRRPSSNNNDRRPSSECDGNGRTRRRQQHGTTGRIAHYTHYSSSWNSSRKSSSWSRKISWSRSSGRPWGTFNEKIGCSI